MFNSQLKSTRPRWFAWGWLLLVVLAHLFAVIGIEQDLSDSLSRLGQTASRWVLPVSLIHSPVQPPAPPPQNQISAKAPSKARVQKEALPVVNTAEVLSDSSAPSNAEVSVIQPQLEEPLTAASEPAVTINLGGVESSQTHPPVNSNAEVPPIKLVAPVIPFEATYLVFQGEADAGATIGKTILRLQKREGVPNGYQTELIVLFNWVTRMLADDRVWRSTGTITDAGFVPELITDIRGKRSPKQTVLDWANLQATGSTNSDNPFTLVVGAQDRISVIWQLGVMARTTPEQFVDQAQVQVPLVVSNKLTTSRWAVQHETITLAGKAIATLRLVRTDTRDDDLRFEFWLDKETSMQPVKLRLSDRGGRIFELLKTDTKP